MIQIDIEDDECPCRKYNYKKTMAWGSYTSLEFVKDKFGAHLIAYGEGEAEWKPAYCPLCGRKL